MNTTKNSAFVAFPLIIADDKINIKYVREQTVINATKKRQAGRVGGSLGVGQTLQQILAISEGHCDCDQVTEPLLASFIQ